jgi:hypothetical protein
MRLILIIFALFFVALPVQADSPYNARGTWFMSWSGIPFAKIWIALEENAEGYRLTASYKSRGIVRIFDKNKSLTLSHGVRLGDTVQTLEYEFENDEQDKFTKLEFDRAGELIRRKVQPEDDPSHRPPVPSTAIKGAVTPGNVLFALRRAVQLAQQQGDKSFAVPFYEGKRLMEVHGRVLGPENYTIGKKSVETIKVEFNRKLLGGFTDKEIKRYAEGEPPLYLYLDAETLFPLAMEIEIKFGTLKAVWKAE